MLIAPIIFCTVVLGIAGMDNLRHVGRVGLYALGYFEIVTTHRAGARPAWSSTCWSPAWACTWIRRRSIPTRVTSYATQAEKQGVVDFLLNIIPTSMFDAFAKGEILQVLLVAVLCGFALQACGARVATLRSGIEGFSAVLFTHRGLHHAARAHRRVRRHGVHDRIAGLAALAPLAKLMLCFYATCLLFVFGVLGTDRAPAWLLDLQAGSASCARSC